jgi:hypothetical protein
MMRTHFSPEEGTMDASEWTSVEESMELSSTNPEVSSALEDEAGTEATLDGVDDPLLDPCFDPYRDNRDWGCP